MSRDAESILNAADAIVAAFRTQDMDAYFQAFSPDSTFIFHSHPEWSLSLGQYRGLWMGWTAGGMKILECTSTNRHVRVHGNSGTFMHQVHTRMAFGTDESQSTDCETILFSWTDDAWLAVHEHMSPITGGAD